MSVILKAQILNPDGSQGTGLTVTIDVERDSDGVLVVTGGAMPETAGGRYAYDFTALYDPEESYSYICDTGLPGIARYAFESIPKNYQGLEDVLENNITIKKFLRGLIAPFLAKRSGMATANTKFRDQADTKNRIDATLDDNGNISSITLDLT